MPDRTRNIRSSSPGPRSPRRRTAGSKSAAFGRSTGPSAASRSPTRPTGWPRARQRRGAGRDGCAGHHAGPQPRRLGHGRPEITPFGTPFDRSNYAAAFDYVIKRYQSECYALKDDPKSSRQVNPPSSSSAPTGTTRGRPTTPPYGASPHGGACRSWSSTGTSASRGPPGPKSLLHAQDTQTIEGVAYGWHPQRGKTNTSRRMAANRHDAQNPAGKIESRP